MSHGVEWLNIVLSVLPVGGGEDGSGEQPVRSDGGQREG